MSRLQNRILFYHGLATMLDAGLPLDRALRLPQPGRFRRTAEALRRSVQAGARLSEAMRDCGEFSGFECGVAAAGEAGGRLPAALASLDSWFARTLALRRKALAGMALPGSLYLAAGTALTAADLLLKRIGAGEAGLRLGGMLLLPAALGLGLRTALLLAGASAAGRLLEAVPVLGPLQRRLETARFFQALGVALASGIPILRGIETAARCCRTRRHSRRFLRMVPMIQDQGDTFAAAFGRIQSRWDARSPIPALVETGEATGRLDDACARIGDLLQEEALRTLGRLAGVVPKAFYLAVLAFLAWRILGIFGGYVRQLETL